LSETFNVPVPCVRIVGERKRTATLQVAFGAKLVTALVGHVVLCTWKITPLVTSVMLVVIGPASGVVPTFLTVTFCAAPKFPPNNVVNDRDEGVTVILTLRPLSETALSVATSGLVSLLLMVIVPAAAPSTVGWNLT
jgi:hypothetical protein